MKSFVDLGIDSFLLDYYKTEFDCIENYFDTLNNSVIAEKEKIKSLAEYLKSKGATEDYIADSLDEDSFNLSYFEDNTFNFAIVFLYSECEKLLKQDYRILTGKSSKSLFNFEDAKKLFKEEDIDLISLTNYSKLNELRILNNCIKHNGYVDEKVSRIKPSQWILHSKLKILYSDVKQYLNEVRVFFDNFVPLVDSRNREKITIEDLDLIKNTCNEVVSSKSIDKQTDINMVLNKLSKL